MELLTELDARPYLFLSKVEEAGNGVLRLVVDVGAESSAVKDISIGGTVISGVRQVSPDDSTAKYEVTFASYIAYAVLNESYASQDGQEAWQGRSFRVYSRSRFLDFVRKATFASSEYPGPFAHYSLVCQDHVVDVVSTAQPEIKRLRRAAHT